MAGMNTLADLFQDELRDVYDAEKRILKALPKMAKAASDEQLRDAFTTHLEETRGHVERLEQVFASIDQKPKGKRCMGMEGIIAEGTELMGEDGDESVLDAGRYDMVFVEPGDRAYSQIRRVIPDLVILCTRIEQLDGFQLLTMLKLDPETSEIPVLTYTTESEGQDFGTVLSQLTEDEESLFPSRAALRMN